MSSCGRLCRLGELGSSGCRGYSPRSRLEVAGALGRYAHPGGPKTSIDSLEWGIGGASADEVSRRLVSEFARLGTQGGSRT
jgi:hypothetical protein